MMASQKTDLLFFSDGAKPGVWFCPSVYFFGASFHTRFFRTRCICLCVIDSIAVDFPIAGTPAWPVDQAAARCTIFVVGLTQG